MTSPTSVGDLAKAVRFLVVDMVNAANSGHPGMPLGMADVATVLWTRHLRFDAAHPDWPDRDRFVLSAGHGSALVYALSWLSGVAGVELNDLRCFRQLGASTAGHPEYGHFPGIETTTGPLGQGLANAVGMAVAEAKLRAEFGADVCDHRVWVIAGDGCLMEGIGQEAITLAGHLGLERLAVLWDDNRITIDGPTELSTSDDQLRRFEAAGWTTLEVDGHDPQAVDDALTHARTAGRPTLIACRTTIGCGAPTMQGSSKVHGAPLGHDERAAMARALGWPHAPFEVPADMRDAWRSAGRRGADGRLEWTARVSATKRGWEFIERINRSAGGDTTRRLGELAKQLRADHVACATREVNARVLRALEHSSGILVGSADLGGSNGIASPGSQHFTVQNRVGTYINYGVREHAMVAALNGIALHGGHTAVGGTFMVFSDYARPAIRLAAMMKLPIILLFTHDSIGVGEDGPTHQPVEQLCALRAIPNLLVIRPADAAETAMAWQIALEQGDRPTVLALTRQSVPSLPADAASDAVCNGAYAVVDPAARDLTLVASGSEVSLAVEAAASLAADGVAAAVVSMPCMELFEEQPAPVQQRVLGDEPRIAIEASTGQSWHRWLRPGDQFVGMRGFGASGPGAALFDHFGITAAAIRDHALRLVGQPATSHQRPPGG